MRNRSLTTLWLIVFTAQTVGVTQAFHLAMEEHDGHAAGKHHGAARSSNTQDEAASRPLSLSQAEPPGHDPAHCPICQTLATFTPLCTSQPLLVVRLEPRRLVLPAASTPCLFSNCISTLGPRAPPAPRLRTPV